MKYNSDDLKKLADDVLMVLNNPIHIQHENVKNGILILSMLFNKSRDEIIRKITNRDWS